MNTSRRKFLALAAGVTTLGGAGLLKAGNAIAAAWNKPAFESKAVNDALKGIGAGTMIESKDIAITAPDIAENGAVVPVAITSRIPNTQTIFIVAEKNPFPL